MATRPHPPGYRCAKALRQLGFEASAISQSLRRQLALDTGEIEAVLACPVTPPDGVPVLDVVGLVVDLTDEAVERPRRRATDMDSAP